MSSGPPLKPRFSHQLQPFLTVPNCISLAGFILVAIGSLRLNSWTGLVLVAVGRLSDIVDGAVARHYHQVSRIGTVLDATLDKLASLAIFTALWVQHMAPRIALGAILAQNAANVVAIYLAKRRHPHASYRPSRYGKFAMAFESLAMIGYAAGYVLGQSQPAAGQAITYAAHVCIVLGVGVFGLQATYGYFQRARSRRVDS